MAQIQKLIQENQKLKYQLEKFKSSNGLLPYIDDSAIKGGYHVVKNISERDSIDCCHRKLGMKVLVIGNDLSFKEYILKTNNCKENIWEEVDVTVEENDVFLIEDYSELSENLTTQKELNLILKQLILNLQNNLDDKLDKGTYSGTAQDLKNEIDGKANISHTHNISDVSNLQTSLNLKEDLSNKAIDFSVVNDVLYPSVKAVDDFVKSQRLEVPFANATSVTINHNLNKLCSVTVYLDDGSFVLCDYYNIDNNNIRVEFSTQQTGKIILT